MAAIKFYLSTGYPMMEYKSITKAKLDLDLKDEILEKLFRNGEKNWPNILHGKDKLNVKDFERSKIATSQCLLLVHLQLLFWPILGRSYKNRTNSGSARANKVGPLIWGQCAVSDF